MIIRANQLEHIANQIRFLKDEIRTSPDENNISLLNHYQKLYYEIQERQLYWNLNKKERGQDAKPR